MSEIMKDMREEAARVAAKRVRVADIESLMRNLGLTTERAMDVLGVPQARRETHAGLVVKRVS